MFKKALFVDFHKFQYSDQMYDQVYKMCEKYTFADSSKDNLVDLVEDVDAIFAFYGSPITKEVINSATKLKYIGVTSTAYSFVDIDAAAKRDIPVTHTASYAAQGVAELIVLMFLYNLRNIKNEKSRIASGDYGFEVEKGRELGEKTLGIIGAGTIGCRVAEICKGFGMEIVYFSREEKERMNVIGAKKMSINDVAKNADHIAVTLSLNKETEGMVNNEVISNIKENAVVTCISHLPLFDVDALYERVKNGEIILATDQIDSLSDEWFEKFRKLEDADLYPHIGAGTVESTQRVEETFVSNIKAFLENSPKNVVNL